MAQQVVVIEQDRRCGTRATCSACGWSSGFRRVPEHAQWLGDMHALTHRDAGLSVVRVEETFPVED